MNIEFWAHMLDEAFDKRSDDEKSNEKSLPKNENEKFQFGEVFTDDLDTDDKIEAVFDEIWPKWFEYFADKVEKEDSLEVSGQRRDVDDWDIWEIRVEDCYDGGIDQMANFMFDDLYGRWNENRKTSLKEIIDVEAKRLIDGARELCDLKKLEDRGRLVYKASYHTGGAYPSA